MATSARREIEQLVGTRLPPAWLARAATGVRARLGRAHDRMAPPFLIVLERLFAVVDVKALAVFVELGLAEHLARAPRAAADLADVAGTDPDATERLLRFLASRGFLVRDRRGSYRHTRASALLRRDHPASLRHWVEFVGGAWHWDIWNHAPHSFRTGGSATVASTGHEFFEYVHDVDPEAGRAFDGAMAEGSRLQGLLVADAYPFAGVRRVCDVGGGTGEVLAAFCRVHPHLSGTLFEVPALGDAAREHLARRGVAGRCEFAGGDFFEAVPPGHDLYTLFAVVHDWDDERCTTILGNVARAMGRDGRALVVEAPLPEGAAPHFARATDLLMLVLSGSGRERTRSEYEALVRRAGLRVTRTFPLPSLFCAFELARR